VVGFGLAGLACLHIGCIYRRGPGWGFPDRVKYLFLPGFYKFPRFGSTVLFWFFFLNYLHAYVAILDKIVFL